MARMVITANLLDDLRRAGKAVTIPHDALLTPAARDWLKEHALPVTWSDGHGSAGADAGKFGLVIDETQASQRSIAMNLERSFGKADRFVAGKDSASLIAAVGKLAKAVQAGRLTHGVVLTDCGSIAACIANKRKGVRAAMASSLVCMDPAVRLLGINVLILEVQHVTYHQIRQLVTRFLQGPATPDPAVAAAIQEAEAS